MEILIFFYKHKWIALGSFVLILFLLFIFFIQLITPGAQQSDPDNISPTISSSNNFRENQSDGNYDKEDIVDPAKLKNLQKKEVLYDGKTTYTLGSSNPQRPDLTTTDKNGAIIFKRVVIPSSSNLKLSSFIKLYGKPKWIFKGSEFYGPTIQTYIYDNYGLALIANPENDIVLEQHLFTPTKVDDYLKKYGEDIPAQP